MPTREGILARCGIMPSVSTELEVALREAVDRAAATDRAAGLTVLDAGCGRSSALQAFRPQIARFVGIDIHEPAPGSMPYLDEFAVVDVCTNEDAFAPATFDVALSSFTVEHFAQPVDAFANVARWLRPGGTLVITTVNRRHPFVAAYLGVPSGLRHRLQHVVKATAADAHPIVGVCNDPRALRSAMEAAGFMDITVKPIGHLARAWGRTWPTFFVGLIGDLMARGLPSRRSTLLVSGRIPAAEQGR
ncbi:MAG TPA: class I SAM-dependent methyltransferase [Candidatus Limnocylindrales bacterium]